MYRCLTPVSASQFADLVSGAAAGSSQQDGQRGEESVWGTSIMAANIAFILSIQYKYLYIIVIFAGA